MSDLPIVAPLGADEARRLTDEVRGDAAALWQKLLRLYEGGAHLALGYSSWGGYFEAEFGQKQSRGYQLLEAARAVATLPHSTMVEWPNERQARELARVKDPEVRAEVWQQVIARDEPVTAAAIRETAEQHAAPPDAQEVVEAEPPIPLRIVREQRTREEADGIVDLALHLHRAAMGMRPNAVIANTTRLKTLDRITSDLLAWFRSAESQFANTPRPRSTAGTSDATGAHEEVTG